MRLFDELKRRKVFRVAAVYTAGAFVVLQAADLLVEALRMPDAVLTGAAILSIIGFPVALVLSWYFDVTPEAPPGDDASEGPAVLPPKTLALVVVLLLAGVAAGWFLRPGGGDVAQEADAAAPSIAILPFENASPDPDNEFFSHGIAEELIYALGKIPDLDVKARSSTWQFAGSSISAQQVADSIGATSILAGRVRRSGDAVDIAIELVGGADGDVIWTDRFEGSVDDIFETQARIAEEIAGALQVRLAADGASAGPRTIDSEAYDHFLRGRYNLALRTRPSILEAVRNFEAAIDADNGFALAWAGLAEAWMLASVYHTQLPPSEMWASSNAAIDRALAIDPDLPQAHAVRGYFSYWAGLWEDADEPLVRALELDPNYTEAMQWLAQVYSRTGRDEEAETLIERAIRREPFSRGITNAAASIYQVLDLDEAAGHALRLIELGQVETGLQALWYTRLYQGRVGEAREAARDWTRELGMPEADADGAFRALEATFDAIEHFRATGEPGEVDPVLVRSPLATSQLQVLVGRPDIAIGQIQSALFEDANDALGGLHQKALWDMRDDPRIQSIRDEVRTRLGLESR